MPVDETKLNTLMERIIGDLGAAFGAALVVLGDKLGLYKAMAGEGSDDPRRPRAGDQDGGAVRSRMAELAGRRGIRDLRRGNRPLPPVGRAGVRARGRGQPRLHPGRVPDHLLGGEGRAEDRGGVSNRAGGSRGTSTRPASSRERSASSAANYAAHLVNDWIPSLDGVEERLNDGARVADVGCGHGASTVLMAQAYPESTFVGFDYHPASIDRARRRAEEAGVTDRVRFEVATAKSFPGDWYDLVACFDCLHDMGDPVGAARHVRESLGSEGTWMIVEPRAGDRVQDNLNPIGRVFYAASTLICTPASVAQEVGPRPRSAGGRGGAPARRATGRLLPRPPRGGNPVQHGARSEALKPRGVPPETSLGVSGGRPSRARRAVAV